MCIENQGVLAVETLSNSLPANVALLCRGHFIDGLWIKWFTFWSISISIETTINISVQYDDQLYYCTRYYTETNSSRFRSLHGPYQLCLSVHRIGRWNTCHGRDGGYIDWNKNRSFHAKPEPTVCQKQETIHWNIAHDMQQYFPSTETK